MKYKKTGSRTPFHKVSPSQANNKKMRNEAVDLIKRRENVIEFEKGLNKKDNDLKNMSVITTITIMQKFSMISNIFLCLGKLL